MDTPQFNNGFWYAVQGPYPGKSKLLVGALALEKRFYPYDLLGLEPFCLWS